VLITVDAFTVRDGYKWHAIETHILTGTDDQPFCGALVTYSSHVIELIDEHAVQKKSQPCGCLSVLPTTHTQSTYTILDTDPRCTIKYFALKSLKFPFLHISRNI